MKISIIVSSYNYEKYLSKTLDSLLNQTWKNWEAIVVDDGSSDGSLDLIRKYSEKDSRIKLLQHVDGRNRGLARTLQLGILESSYEWISFCESDDWWEPTFLQEIVNAIKGNSEYELFFSDVILEGSSPSMEDHCNFIRQHFRNGGNAFELHQKKINSVPTFSAVVVKRSILESCNFDAYFPPSLDMWLWCQLSIKTKFYFLDVPLSHWRQHEISYMKQSVIPDKIDWDIVHEFHRRMDSILELDAKEENLERENGSNQNSETIFVGMTEKQVIFYNRFIKYISILLIPIPGIKKKFRRQYLLSFPHGKNSKKRNME